MKKKALIVILFFGGLALCEGQVNLVLNPSFESYSACPISTGGEMNKALNWDTCRASADYFNICGINSACQVPLNFFGYQQPASGNAYCGFWAYDNTTLYRELLIGKLLSPLTISQKYFVSFKISRADSDYVAGYSTNKIGSKFSTVKQSYASINNSDHFHTNNIITDTLNWVRVSGSFIADSAYKYIMLGNFHDDFNTISNHDGIGPGAYYYMDDVCLSTDSMFANTYSYITGINNYLVSKKIEVFPNPANQSFHISYAQNSTVEISDAFGNILFKGGGSIDKDIIINCSSWNSGIYFIKVDSSILKLIINH